ncbi:MAG: hypothetical protein PF444_09470 [Bacteroidales bacterium]|jgi:hypothetical protein|nr:hypothetical protein [Bacteroidales bacterium]
MKKSFLAFLSFILFLALNNLHAFAQLDENVYQNSSVVTAKLSSESLMDEDINFNTNWKFQLGELFVFYVPNYNDNNWRTLDVPHDWSIEGKFDEQNPCGSSGGFLLTGIGSYLIVFQSKSIIRINIINLLC